jgi:hypothetical protein
MSTARDIVDDGYKKKRGPGGCFDVSLIRGDTLSYRTKI